MRLVSCFVKVIILFSSGFGIISAFCELFKKELKKAIILFVFSVSVGVACSYIDTIVESLSGSLTQTGAPSASETEGADQAQEPSTESQKTYSNVPQIPEQVLAVDPIEEKVIYLEEAKTQRIDDIITEDDEIKQYDVTPAVDGNYRFQLDDIPDGTEFYLRLYNARDERIGNQFCTSSGEGFEKELATGNRYYVQVKQVCRAGGYSLNIGLPNEVAQVEENTDIRDSFKYIGQVNRYAFVARNSGQYCFQISNCSDGTYATLELTNAVGDILNRKYDVHEDYLLYDLEEGHTYNLVAKQHTHLGEYVVKINAPKVLKDITEYSVIHDSVQYPKQQNDYQFTPAYTGLHRFEFLNVPDGTDFSLYIYNGGWEQIISSIYLDNGDGISLELEAGKTYFIRVKQYEKYGNYSLKIGSKKKINEISVSNGILDSIEYTEQQNDYVLTAPENTRYCVLISNVADGVAVNVSFLNMAYEVITGTTLCSDGEIAEANLEAGKQYYIRVSQKYGLGEYTVDFYKKSSN